MYFYIFLKKIIRILSVWSVGLLLFNISFAQTEAEPGDLIITEIFTRSNGSIPDYIEIYNRSLFSHNLLNWKISIFGTEYVLDNSDILDALELGPFKYMIITGQDGYFSNSDNEIFLANGDLRLSAESPEYNTDFASFVQSAPNTSIIENAVWAPFALSHSASEIDLISEQNIVIDHISYNSDEYQIGGEYIGHSIELTNDIPQGNIPFQPLTHLPSYWEYSKHSRPFMFSSDILYGTDNLFMEFGSPGKRNYLNSVITVTNLQCGPDPASNDFCFAPNAECVSQDDIFNNASMCSAIYPNTFNDHWDVERQICTYECQWSDTTDIYNMELDNPKYNIYHDRIPGGIKTLIFEANESTTHESDAIITYKWFKNGNVFQNGSHIEAEFAEGQHELVLLIKNEDDIWAVDTFNFEVKEPNQKPTPIISIETSNYTIMHNGDPNPQPQPIALYGTSSCDCNDYIRYEFLTTGNIINDENYECSCEPTDENPIDWVGWLQEKCDVSNQIECEDEDHIDYCIWNPNGIDANGETISVCEYSEIEYYFWTKDGTIEGNDKFFTTNLSDIGDYVFSLILTDTYGENNSESIVLTINKEDNLPPLAVINGPSTVFDFTEPNGIPYDEGTLDLENYDASHDQSLLDGQNNDDAIFSQWYTVDGVPINSDDSNGDAHQINLPLGTFTFTLEVLDSYNCYSKTNYGEYINDGFEDCYSASNSDCQDNLPQCRWYQNECTPYCELYSYGECDGLGEEIAEGTHCETAGVNEIECGVGGTCIFLSSDYDTMTVILSEENSPPIVNIGTNNFGYMEQVIDSITPSVFDIEFYNQGNEYCFLGYETNPICDVVDDPNFDTKEEKCCLQVQWEVVSAHLGSSEFIDLNNDGIDDNWINCNTGELSDSYCNSSWLQNPDEKNLKFIPPENIDFYPDSVRLKLIATDPFYNAGISELFGEDEVVIIIENDNQPPIQLVQFEQDYNIIEDSTTIEFDLSEYFYDPDGEILNYYYIIPNNQLIDEEVIEINDDGFLIDSRLFIQNILDKNGDAEIEIYAKDSEYTISTTFSIRVVPNNDQPVAYSTIINLDECLDNCNMGDLLVNPSIAILNGNAGGCGINNNPDDCEDDNLTFEILSYPPHGQFIQDLDITIEETYNYYPYENFFGYDTTTFIVIDNGSSAGIYDPDTSEVGIIIFHIQKSDNDAPQVQELNFTLKEDYLVHFTVYHPDSLQDNDSLNFAYIGLNVFDEDNNCLAESSINCNDSIYNLDSLKVYVQNGSLDYEFFTITDTNPSVIKINENYNNSLIVPVIVSDHEDLLGNSLSEVYDIQINLIQTNDKPFSENTLYQFDEDETYHFNLNGDDVEDDILAFEVIKLPTRLDSISPSNLINSESIFFNYGEIPEISFKPEKDFNGLDSLIYLIYDNGTTNGEPDTLISDSIIVWFNINQINDAPRIDSIYFDGNDTLNSIVEDTSNVNIIMVYTDIDSDPNLNEEPVPFNLNWQFNSSNSEEGLKFWFNSNGPTVIDVLENPLRRKGLFTIDSLLANWNGVDTSIINIIDDDGELLEFEFSLSVEPINDPPTISNIKIDTTKFDSLSNWEFDYDKENGTIMLAEDSKNIPLIIDYFDIDTDTNLNANPDTIAGFSWNIYSNKNKLITSYATAFDSILGKDIFEFYIDSISQDWNGIDSLITIITDTIGDSYFDTLLLQVYQVNDSPEPFEYFPKLNTYSLFSEDSVFNNENENWIYRLPFINDPIEDENPLDILIKWNRTTDIDLVDSLNNHSNRIKNLFYRIELEGDRSGYNFILKSGINDSIFNDSDYCNNHLESIGIDSNPCENLNLLDSNIAFTKIDLTQPFLTYNGAYFDSLYATPDTITQLLDLTNNKYYYCNNGSNVEYATNECNDQCPETCTNTNYQLKVIAYNASRVYNPDDSGGDEGYDFQNIDSPQFADSEDSSAFNVDLTLPNFQFNVIRNDIFWEYYDLYITNSEPILESVPGTNYSPLLIIEYSDSIVIVDRTSSEHGPIHYTGRFMDEGNITFSYSARDYAKNYGISSKTISYKIIDPLEKVIVSTPSNSGEIIIEEGTMNEFTGIIAEDIVINNELNKTENNIHGVSFKPQYQPLLNPINLRFNINLLNLPNANSWNYSLFKKENGNWVDLDIRFEKNDDLISTFINELGEFYVQFNADAVKPIPNEFVLYPNYPNPFNGSTTIKFEIPKREYVNIKIINILGETVNSIYSGFLEADLHSFNWNGKDKNSNIVSSGLYFIQLNINEKKHLQKIMYIK
ncbi:MAG: T9SS type A sorting domain-containing protein [Candidatus Marinimicrobia bacterium]|nr:T9SS type A sorting domain-containing protein [Candidatus Neomarinimicrobiota bacterium]